MNRVIITAVQRGNSVYAYGEKNAVLLTITINAANGDGLVGYTSSTLSVRKGKRVYTYNTRGSCISNVSAG
ncbi:MAG: hypothetical protein ACK4FF_02070 [Limnobacter sp.]|uniref:hypothetical protein n=1 Tax=Limnobacter sp. TaxID=2003368 RepID=UPI00391A119C